MKKTKDRKLVELHNCYIMRVNTSWDSPLIPQEEEMDYQQFCEKYNLKMIPKISAESGC